MAQAKTTTICFNTQGNDKQLEVAQYWVDQTTIDIAYGGSKGSGKSYLGASLIFGDALIYPNTHYFIARKKLNDLRKYTQPTISEVLTDWGIDERYYSFNGQDNYYTLYNGSKVFLIEAAYQPSDPDYHRFGSMQMTRGWVEEVGEFHEKAVTMLQASIGRWKNDLYNLPGKLLLTLNPAKNFVYEKYYLAKKENRLPDFRKFVQALPTDNKKLPKGYIPNLLRILDHRDAQRLVYGVWEYDDNPYAMFEYDGICNLFTNSFNQKTGKRYLSLDIAYMGADTFVATTWDGFVVEKVRAIDKIDEVAIGNQIIQWAEEDRVPYSNIVYDADGLRKFTANSLKKLTAAKPFVNNSKPLKDQNFHNLKTECAFKLRELIGGNLIFIADLTYKKQIMADLEQICREPADAEGKIKLEPKKKFKERTGRSPDFFDSLLMRMFFELKNTGGWA